MSVVNILQIMAAVTRVSISSVICKLGRLLKCSTFHKITGRLTRRIWEKSSSCMKSIRPIRTTKGKFIILFSCKNVLKRKVRFSKKNTQFVYILPAKVQNNGKKMCLLHFRLSLHRLKLLWQLAKCKIQKIAEWSKYPFGLPLVSPPNYNDKIIFQL